MSAADLAADRVGRPRLRRALAHVPLYLVVAGVGLTILLPVLYAALGGFRTTGQLAAHPVGLPSPWNFSNYADILGSGSFWQQVGNSAVIAFVATFLIVALSALAAFVFARFAFRGREVIYGFFTLGLLFPIAVAILPLFITIRQLGLLNSPLGVALPQAAFDLPLTIIILRPFFRGIPAELEDAAAIDGAGPLRFLWDVVLPMSRPALTTVAVLGIVKSWNAFLLPLVVLTDPVDWTLPLGVTNFSTQYSVDTARVLAFTTLAMLPMLVFYVFAERQIVSGLTAGAVKG
jgi:raffinose/stachyose/melibiose transport system permease protein